MLIRTPKLQVPGPGGALVKRKLKTGGGSLGAIF